MTKLVKDNILYQLNFLKSIGFNYHDTLYFNSDDLINSNLPNNLDELKVIVENCYLCDLCKSRKNVLFGYGNSNAKVIFILDEPTISEDEVGQFFVGKSGEMLKNMIEKVLKLSIEDIYITSIVKCKSNSGFSTKHANSCRLYLNKQIELINPILIVAFGEKTYKHLIDNSISFIEARGNMLPYKKYNVLPTFSPNFLLRNPSLKKEAYYDMLKIKSILEMS